MWATLLACLGYIDEDVVTAVNSFVGARVAKTGREPQSEGLVKGPQLSRRNLAATQGQEVPEVRGVFHTTSEGKKAREAAKAAVQESEWHVAGWWNAHNKGKIRAGDRWWEEESQRLAVVCTRENKYGRFDELKNRDSS